MFVVFTRALLLYLIVVVVMRMMGKRQVAQMQPFELVIMILIADLAATPMENMDIPLVNGIIPIIALLSVQVLTAYFSLKNEKFRDFVCGKPSILIHKGRIDQTEMHRLRVNINDLLEALRNKNQFNISDVEYAILETNGQISIIPRADKRPVVTGDLGIMVQEEQLPVTLISGGKLNSDKLRKAGHDKKWLMDQLKTKHRQYKRCIFGSYIN